MKLLFAIKALDDAHGGAERVLSQIASGLAQKGHDVSILSFDQPDGTAFYPLDIHVKRLSIGIGNVKSSLTPLDFLKKIIALRKVVQKMQPDCVIGFMHSTFVPAAFGMIGTDIPLIASEHIVPEHYKNRKKEYALFLVSRFFIKKITVLSKTIIASYSPVFHSRMTAIANPVHPAKHLADVRGENVPTKTIINVGRLEDQKDHETLIKAFAVLANDYPDWTLRILGEGSLRTALEDLVAELDLRDRISLPGVTAEIETEYASAQIFALSSKYESFGLATAEAMAHGLPTLGFSSCPGTNELISHNLNGLLMPDSDDRVSTFSNGLEMLIASAELRKKLGDQGINTIKQFHLDGIVQKWEELIMDTIEN